MIDYFLRYVELPRRVEGLSIPNDDGSFDIYINSLLSPQRRKEVLQHELRHLESEHFYLDMPISRMERQAEGEDVNVVLHPPKGMLPCFHSEQHMAAWLDTVCRQKGIKL